MWLQDIFLSHKQLFQIFFMFITIMGFSRPDLKQVKSKELNYFPNDIGKILTAAVTDIAAAELELWFRQLSH